MKVSGVRRVLVPVGTVPNMVKVKVHKPGGWLKPNGTFRTRHVIPLPTDGQNVFCCPVNNDRLQFEVQFTKPLRLDLPACDLNISAMKLQFKLKAGLKTVTKEKIVIGAAAGFTAPSSFCVDFGVEQYERPPPKEDHRPAGEVFDELFRRDRGLLFEAFDVVQNLPRREDRFDAHDRQEAERATRFLQKFVDSTTHERLMKADPTTGAPSAYAMLLRQIDEINRQTSNC